jgi:hypothetical protein
MGGTLRNFRPMGFSVVLGDGWFTGLGSQLIRIDLLRVIANDTSSDPYTVVVFPSGVLPRLDLAPLAVSGRLYVAGSDRRLHAISPDGVRVGQSAPMPASYGAFSTNLVQIGRVFYIGTNQGWVVQFDALTGVLRTARRVSMQPIHSLAPTLMGRGLLVRAGARELYALHPSQMNTLWRRAFTEDLVSPVVASSQSEVGAVVDKQGRLFVFHTRAGFNMPLYPQPIFGEQQTGQRVGGDCAPCGTRRRLCLCVGATRARGDQPAGAAAHRDAGEPAQSPGVRREYPACRLALPPRRFCITGTAQGSYCLLTSLRAESYGGTVAGIPLR